MSGKIFPTAQDAENAFYEALERCDLEGMMAVWAEDEDIVCVHPAGRAPHRPGRGARELGAMFAAGPRARVTIAQQVAISGMMLAVHSVHENFSVEGEARRSRAADRRHQRLPAHRRGLAHDRAPRLAGAGAAAAPAAARDSPAENPALR